MRRHRGRRILVHGFVVGGILVAIAACSSTNDTTPATPTTSPESGTASSSSSSGSVTSSSSSSGSVALKDASDMDAPNADGATPGIDGSTPADGASPDAAMNPDASPDASGTKDASTPDASMPDASSTPDAAADAAGGCMAIADAGAMCHDLVNIGTNVPLVATGTNIPTGTGGPILDGRYVLTSLQAYNGSPAIGLLGSLNQTVLVCGKYVYLSSDDVGQPHYTKTMVKDAVTNIPNDNPPLCGTQSPNRSFNTTSYTATAGAITLYSTSLGLSVTYTMK